MLSDIARSAFASNQTGIVAKEIKDIAKSSADPSVSASAKVTAKQALNKQITSFDQTKLNIRQLLSTYFECVGIFYRW